MHRRTWKKMDPTTPFSLSNRFKLLLTARTHIGVSNYSNIIPIETGLSWIRKHQRGKQNTAWWVRTSQAHIWMWQKYSRPSFSQERFDTHDIVTAQSGYYRQPLMKVYASTQILLSCRKRRCFNRPPQTPTNLLACCFVLPVSDLEHENPRACGPLREHGQGGAGVSPGC